MCARSLITLALLLPFKPLIGCSGGAQLTLQRSETLYIHPPAREDVRVGLGFFSHEAIGAERNHRHIDDFVLDAPARVTGVRWWGLVDGAGGGDDLSNIEAFTITVHDSTPEGGPGAPLMTERFDITETDPLPTGRRGSGVAPATSTAQEFSHRVRFNRALNLAEGATYWLGVRAHRIDPSGDNWQWQDGVTIDGVSYSRALEREDGWIRIDDTDSAFEVLGWRQEIDPAFDRIR